MSTQEDELNIIIGKYGIVTIHKMLEKKMKEDYTYLKKLFEKETIAKPKDKVTPKEMNAEDEIVVVDEENIVSLIDELRAPKEELQSTQSTQSIQSTQSKSKDPKEMKAWQKAEEDKKRKEQEAKGINPKDLLTKENLKKWYVDDGKTFAFIAREYVGCKDSEVSSAAKLFGLQSTRKNVMIHAKK